MATFAGPHGYNMQVPKSNPNQMDPKLYSAAISGNVDVITSHVSNYSTDQVLELLTPNWNTILHLASQSGKLEAIQFILSKHPSLVSKVNSDGDSALHIAARSGFTDIVNALITCAKKLDAVDEVVESKLQSWVGLSRLENKEGDTALHEATRYNHIQVVSMLLDEDPDFNPSINKSGESPLYLAARRGFSDLIDIIIKARVTPSFVGPNGRTALHGAVFCNSKESTIKLLRWNNTLVHSEDRYSLTPLHYVARLGFADVAIELLSVDTSIAYNANNGKRSTAILVAASAGHLSVVKEIISHCPSCCEMVDAKGRNILHIAIEHEQKNVIKYLAEECSTLISSLIIQKDNDGKKPLDLLNTCKSNCVVPNLLEHLLADKDAFIDNDSTLLDFVKHYDSTEPSTSAMENKMAKTSAPHASDPSPEDAAAKNEIANTSAPHASDPSPEDAAAENKIAKTSAPPDQGYVNARRLIDNHMIVAALIATVAFTAGFAMPGGYIQSGSPNQGMAVLGRNSVAFQAFVISDAIAVLLSTSALFTYFLSAIFDEEDIKILGKYAIGGTLLNMFGLGAIIVAFISGTYAVLHSSYALAIAASVIASSIFLIHSAIFLHYFSYFAYQ